MHMTWQYSGGGGYIYNRVSYAKTEKYIVSDITASNLLQCVCLCTHTHIYARARAHTHTHKPVPSFAFNHSFLDSFSGVLSAV
jgi:hypothetical protein